MVHVQHGGRFDLCAHERAVEVIPRRFSIPNGDTASCPTHYLFLPLQKHAQYGTRPEAAPALSDTSDLEDE